MVTALKGDKDLGMMLKRQRLLAGLTLRQLGAYSGVSPSQMSRIERGEYFPSVRVLRKIAQPLGFSEGELFVFVGYFLT